MRNRIEWRDAVLSSVEDVAAETRKFVFDMSGHVPRFAPGSHVNIRVMINGEPAIRTYSALPADSGQIAIAVKLHEHSRGGSRAMWRMQVGETTRITLPENRFELSWRANHYLLVAGGIGITPIYGMAQALADRGVSVRLVYGARSRTAMAFADDLQQLLGERLALHDSSADSRIDFAKEFSAVPPNAEVYLCGPIGMLEAAKTAWAEAGHPPSRLRYEVFGDSGLFAEKRFTVDILNHNKRVEVGPDETLLDALLQSGVDMVYDCKRGECGLCAVKIVEKSAEIDHRDVFLSPHEKAENQRMCACVSRLTEGNALIDIGYRG